MPRARRTRRRKRWAGGRALKTRSGHWGFSSARMVRARGYPSINRHSFIRTCIPWDPVQSNVSTNAGPAGQGNNLQITHDGWYLDTGSGLTANITYYGCTIFFTLDMLPDVAEFTSLFDQYRIDWVDFSLKSFCNMNPQQSGAGGIALPDNQPLSGFVTSILDFDDAVIPAPTSTGTDLMREYKTFREHRLISNGPIVHRKFLPAVQIAAFNAVGPAITSSVIKRHQWLNCNAAGIPHYALKMQFTAFSPDTAIHGFLWMRPEIKMKVSFRNVR